MHGTGGDEPRQRVCGDVVVVDVESPVRDAVGCREGMKLVQTLIADQVRPQPTMGGPDGIIDENGHAASIRW
jgi:hypothetical protein